MVQILGVAQGFVTGDFILRSESAIKLCNGNNAALTITLGGAATFVSTVTATNFITTSDKRLKSNIIPIKEGLETLKKFVSYEYIKDKKQDAGFIAQEVKEIIPYSVFENSDGYLTMNDRPILAHMHKAIIELDKRLSAIEEELK